MFYTRIPVPRNLHFSNEALNKSTRYFPFIGIVVGGSGAFVFWGLHFVLPFQLAIILSMAATILLTGAFHEDAFSDFCDGFGGGYTKDRILEIMKDSRIGTYGAVGIVCMLLSKFFSLSNMQAAEIPIILVSAHAFSRFLPVCLIYSSVYVVHDESKSKPIGQKSKTGTLLMAAFFGLILLVLVPLKAVLFIVACSVLLFVIFRRYVIRHIGGYTGDVLGALQQLTEIVFYVGFLFYKQNMV